ncbi:hypothetical protein [Desulfocicer niacini]
MTSEQIKKAITEITGENCELCGNPLKVYVSHREQDGMIPLHMTVRVSCPFCESEVDQLSGIDELEDYDGDHLEDGGTLHGYPAITEVQEG